MEKKSIFLAAILALILLSGCIEPPEKCGDGTCEEKENWKNCEADCPKPAVSFCGDKVCDAKETANTKLCPQDCPTVSNCPDGICDAKENANPALCPQDCRQIQTHTECQNQLCTTVDGAGTNQCTSDSDCTTQPQTHLACQNQQCITVEGAGTNQCTANAECTSTTESHFGLHSDFGIIESIKDPIRELSGVYVRAGIRDSVGWTIVKENGRNIPLCKSCCISPPSPDCNCDIGDKFYCNMPRETLLASGRVMDFYEDDFKLHATVGANQYGDKPPEFLTAAYPEGKEDVYKEFIRTLVEHPPGISDKVKYWAIENEAQAPMFWSGGAQGYADLVLLANSEIKSYCPDCKVGINLGTPEPNEKWLEAMFGICNSIDFLDLHYPALEETVLDRWKTECPGIEIISTETGLPDLDFKGKDGVTIENRWGGTPEKQAQDLIKYNSVLFHAGYNQVFWFTIDFDWDPEVEDDYWEHAGLLTKDYVKKPAFDSFKVMMEKVDYFTSIEKLGESQYKYVFPNKDPVYVLWCDSGTCDLPSEINGTVKITDYLGNEETKPASEIVLTYSPVFVETF